MRKATARLRENRAQEDFLRIRDLLVEIYRPEGRPVTWDLCRWNYARHFVAPLRSGGEGIRFWEDAVSVWEDDEGGIVGVVHTEEPWRGEAWLQRRPDWGSLLPEMVARAEETLSDPDTGRLTLHVHDHDAELLEVVRRRGYRKGRDVTLSDSEFVIAKLPERRLPEGYVIRSMADEPDIEPRRKVLGLSFNHPDPADWATASTYRELVRAPDYRPDLDLFVVGPDGEYVSCCIVWFDGHNRMAPFEPVGTRPEFRRKGVGREVVAAGIRRVAALGAERAVVGTDMHFYLAIGFRRRSVGHAFSRRVPSGP
ncbi:MAG: GNAT family N-acetyltransferase [Planctomycetota bacterium]